MIMRALCGLLGWALLLGGCKPVQPTAPSGRDGAVAAREPAPRVGGTLTFYCEAEPPHLLYMLQPDTWIVRITRDTVFEGLLRQDPHTHTYVPSLADRFERSPDGLRYDFHLRADVRWHDGQPFSAQDVLFTFESLMDPKGRAASARADFEGLTKWEQTGPDTVRLTFSRALFTHVQALAFLPILPKHLFAGADLGRHPARRAPIGTGPFRFDHWTPREEIVLSRNEAYWGPRANLEKVIFRLGRDRMAAWQLLRRGEMDFLWRALPQQLEEVAGVSPAPAAGPLHRVPYDAPSLLMAVYNTRRPTLATAKLRRAMTLLLNRPFFVEKILRGAGRPVSGPYLPDTPAYDAQVAPLPFDPAAAGKLLDEEGWVDTDGDGIRQKGRAKLSLSFLLVAGSKLTEQLASVWQQDLRRAGVKMEIVAIDWAVFLERAHRHEFDVTVYSPTFVYEQDLEPLFASKAAADQNFGSYANPDADRLIAQIRSTLDPAARAELQHELHRLLAAEQPAAFLVQEQPSAVTRSRVHVDAAELTWNVWRDFWVE